MSNKMKRKPNWSVAPEWAEWWAVDRDGTETWFEAEPRRAYTRWVWEADSQFEIIDGTHGTGLFSGWKNMREERPS